MIILSDPNRVHQLRMNDPHGLRSTNELERQALWEALERAVDAGREAAEAQQPPPYSIFDIIDTLIELTRRS